MPIRINQHAEAGGGRVSTALFTGRDFNYKYPIKGLKPGDELHTKLVDMILDRAQESRREISARFDSWKNVERTLTVYVNPDRKAEAESDQEKVEPIIVPVSYAILETLLTYMVAAFIENPLFKYVGVGPEDITGAVLLQEVINNDCIRNKVALNLHTMFRSGFVYGLGPVAPSWVREEVTISTSVEKGFWTRFGNFVGSTVNEPTTRIIEGNALNNIDPFMYLPDPNVPVHEVQKGEFVGWVDRTNFYELLTEEKHSENKVFNVKYLKDMDGRSQIYETGRSSSGKDEATGMSSRVSIASNKPVDVITMYVNLIPREHKLGKSEYPEKWLFRLAADSVIIQAEPAGFNHNKFPVIVNAPDFDGHSICPISKIETVYGLQELVDWLFQSHIANIKKSINDMIVYDPYIINSNDITNPGPGKLIRTRAASWGKTKISDAIHQLNVTDVTRGHIADVSIVQDIMKYTSGAVDNIAGLIQPRGERISAAEVRGSRSSALSRLEKSAKITSIQAMQDIAAMFASHTQQLLSSDTYISIYGEVEEQLINDRGIADRVNNGKVKVRPQDLMIYFDVVPKDGSVPGPENVDSWTQIYQIIASRPELSMQFDLVRIFKHMAKLLGAKGIDDFVRRDNRVKLMADEMLAQEVMKGNLARIEEVSK